MYNQINLYITYKKYYGTINISKHQLQGKNKNIPCFVLNFTKPVVLRIRDLLDSNSKILDFKAFMTKFQVQCIILLYYEVIKAIHPNWLCEIEQICQIDKQLILTNNHSLSLMFNNVAMDIHKASTKLICKLFIKRKIETPPAISKWENTYDNL